MKARHEFGSEYSWQQYLRTYFAAMAMQGYLASCDGWASPSSLEEISKRSVISADALITSLNQTQTP